MKVLPGNVVHDTKKTLGPETHSPASVEGAAQTVPDGALQVRLSFFKNGRVLPMQVIDRPCQ